MSFDFDGFRRAHEERDAETLAGFYTDDAEVTVTDAENGPSNPRVLRGREEIAAYRREVASREMTHRMTGEVIAGDRGAYLVDCRYPDGTAVLCSGSFELRDGLIARERDLQAWDA